MAGPRFLGINNVINPYDGARQALNDAGSIYNQFREQTRRDDDARRLQEDHDRQRIERETLANYAPVIGNNFFGIDSDTQNYIRQNEELAIRQNEEALARKDPKALTRKQLEDSFAQTRTNLADRNTVFGNAVNDLVAQGVSLDQAQLRAQQLAGSYRSTADLAAAEQQRIETINKAEQDRINTALALYKTDASNRRALVSGFTGSTGSGSTKSATGSSKALPPGQAPQPEDITKAIDGLAEITGNTGILSGDADKAVRSALGAYNQTNTRIREANEAKRQQAITQGIDPATQSYEPLLSWTDVMGQVTSTLQLEGFDNRGAYNTVGEATAGITEPLRMQNATRVGTNPNGTSGNRLAAPRLSIEQASAILNDGGFARDILQRNPAIARSLTDLNKDRVSQAYSQFMRANPQAVASTSAGTPERNVPAPTSGVSSNRSPADAVVSPQGRVLGTNPRAALQTTAAVANPATSPVINNVRTGGTLAAPNVQGLNPQQASFVQSATNELTRLFGEAETATPEDRTRIQARINQVQSGLQDVGGLDRVAAALDNNLPILRAQREEQSQRQELFNQFRELQNQARSSGGLFTPRDVVSTDRALSEARLQAFIRNNPEIVQMYNNQQNTERENFRNSLDNSLIQRSFSRF